MSRSDYQGSSFSGNWAGSQYPAPPSHGPPLSGLAAWWKGDAGVTTSGGNITAWVDQVAGISLGPYAGHAVPFNATAINGLPGATFGADSGLFETSTAPIPVGSARTVIVACKFGTFSGTDTAVAFAGGPWFACLFDSSGDIYSDASSKTQNASFVPSSNTAYVFEWGWDGNTSHLVTFAENGTTKTVTQTGGSGTSGGIGNTFTIGNITNVSLGLGTGFIGDICEVLIYGHVLSAPDLAQVRTYLMNRYGV